MDIEPTKKRDKVRAVRLGFVEKGVREQASGNRRLVIVKSPKPVYNQDRQVIGVQVLVRLYEGSLEVPIDGHRVLVNPPLRTEVDGEMVQDPHAAFWAALWHSVESTPAPEGWRP